MSPSESAPALESCATCGQKTATAFIRTVKKRRICALCADRSMQAETAAQADIEDHRLHGGLGWLWKHIAFTAYVSVGGLVLRYFIKSYFLAH